MYTLCDPQWCTLGSISTLLNFKALFWLRMLKGAIVTTVDKESLVVVGEGATGLIVMTYALPQSLTVFHFVSLSHRTAKLLSISPRSFGSLLLPTSFVCMFTSLVRFHIFQCEFFIFFASLDRNMQHPKISFPQLMLKQNTTEESLHRWVLENVPLVSSFAAYCSGVKGKKSIYIFFLPLKNKIFR